MGFYFNVELSLVFHGYSLSYFMRSLHIVYAIAHPKLNVPYFEDRRFFKVFISIKT